MGKWLDLTRVTALKWIDSKKPMDTVPQAYPTPSVPCASVYSPIPDVAMPPGPMPKKFHTPWVRCCKCTIPHQSHVAMSIAPLLLELCTQGSCPNSSTPYGSGYRSVPYPICQVFQCPYPHSCWGCVPWVHAQIVQHLMGPVSQVHHTPSVPSSSVHGPFRSGTMSPGAHAQILPQPMGPVSQVFCILWFLSPKCPIPTDFACKSSVLSKSKAIRPLPNVFVYLRVW